MNTIHLEIVTPDGLIYDGNAKSVVLPGSEGEFGVLAGHAALVSLLKVGIVDVENEDGSHDIIAIDWGYAEVDENRIIVLVEGAVHVAGSSESQIAQSLEKAKALVQNMSSEGGLLNAAFAKIDSAAKAR